MLLISVKILRTCGNCDRALQGHLLARLVFPRYLLHFHCLNVRRYHIYNSESCTFFWGGALIAKTSFFHFRIVNISYRLFILLKEYYSNIAILFKTSQSLFRKIPISFLGLKKPDIVRLRFYSKTIFLAAERPSRFLIVRKYVPEEMSFFSKL
ncbi:MAG: hypothetical protein JWM20_721 [Patescibacteria group bacterium]|nr:hypothetical protein [Patescibacteria group bacterium]